MEPDEMQTTNKAEIVKRYRSLLTDFWKVDSRFSAQTLATEEKKKSDTNSAKNEYDSTDRSLLHRKNSDLDRIHTEESSIRNSAEEKRNQISESAKTTKDALHEIAFGHFVNLSDDRSIQIESDIDFVRALNGLVSTTQRSANRIKDEIEDYKKWKETHSKIVMATVIAGTIVFLAIIIFGKREFDISKDFDIGKRLYSQQNYLGVIEKFESLQYRKSIFKKDAYYHEIQSLLGMCYYNSAKTAIEQGEVEKADAFLNKLSPSYSYSLYQNERIYLQTEISYQRGVQAMKRKDWSTAISYFNGLDKNYKLTRKFLQECNWRLRGERAPTQAETKTTQPASATAPAEVKMVELDIKLPKPMFVGTPQSIQVPKLEKPLGKARPPFLAPEGTTNVAFGRPVKSSDEAPLIGELKMITDGDNEAGDGSYVELGPFLQNVTVDLGKKHTIYAVLVWHYHKQPRVYYDVIVQVADDANFTSNVSTLYNNDLDNSAKMGIGSDNHYVETAEGRLIDAKGVQGRYVRLYSNGNSNDDLNHYIEVAVYGKPAGAI